MGLLHGRIHPEGLSTTDPILQRVAGKPPVRTDRYPGRTAAFGGMGVATVCLQSCVGDNRFRVGECAVQECELGGEFGKGYLLVFNP